MVHNHLCQNLAEMYQIHSWYSYFYQILVGTCLTYIVGTVLSPTYLHMYP